ncbi:hypothetical protein K458DRAFT_354106 [Lentithecium fluviatile CBS 122367]|uniref:Uncharacterized protein n=1 Tax=Lentithecium fluviatile CBS 122367 TaxID=1168545 RepID=A0A6G1JN35_9PLEO|nr:hypothetical protein K458DRAFT_354106 [Lentithecium fluviatile CBS 122367]
MSWNFCLHQINRSFDQIAQWYHEFMHRVEASFRALHERLEYLERRQAGQGPTDEQVERVLRKILAERFADAGIRRFDDPTESKDGDFLTKKRHPDHSIPKTIAMDITTLHVDPEAVPSKAYGQAFRVLEKGLEEFPQVDVAKSALKEGVPVDKNDAEFKRPQLPPPQTDTKPW